ncbi:MAG: hypothetical protein ACE5HL_12815 [Terriglobia bacterium]
MKRLARYTALLSLALLAPLSAHAQFPFIQYGVKRLFKEFGRGVRVRPYVLETPDGGLTGFDRIEVARFDNEILELMPYRMDEELPGLIARRLKKDKLFPHVALAPSSPAPASPEERAALEPPALEQSPRTLLLTGAIKDYYPGSEGLRALNMGLRSLYVIVQVRLRDKATGGELYREQIAVDVYKVRGDAYRNALKAVAKEVAQRLHQQRQEHAHAQPKTEKKQTAQARE